MKTNKQNDLAINRTLKGFPDKLDFRKDLEDYISLVLESEFRKMSYTHIKVPTLEQQQYFSSEFVGTHPWPGWHPKSLFSINVRDYKKVYEAPPTSETQCFLIPEVTASVCRYVAHEINKGELLKGEPFKAYYNQSCFRNEIIDRLSERRLREFTQIGLEYMGIGGVYIDFEVFMTAVYALEALGFTRDQISIRINDVRLFNHASKKSKLTKDDENRIKNLLDKLASSRILKDQSEEKKVLKELKKELSKIIAGKEIFKLWDFFLEGYKEEKDIKKSLSVFPKSLTKDLIQMFKLSEDLDLNLRLDPGIVRSQEYYNSIVFQFDIKGGDHITAEVGGGGRYDYLIGRLLNIHDDKTVIFPATGFAFSLERIMLALVYTGLIRSRSVTIPTRGIDYVIRYKDIDSSYKLLESLKTKGYTVQLFYPKYAGIDIEKYANQVKADILEG